MCKTLFVVFLCLAFLNACASNRSTLTNTKYGVNNHLSQEREPTEKEKKAGLQAIKKWQVSESERSDLADDLVLGKTLIGLHANEVIKALGPLKGNYDNEQYLAGKSRSFVYGLPLGNWSQNDLVIELDESGKVGKAYIDVNY